MKNKFSLVLFFLIVLPASGFANDCPSIKSSAFAAIKANNKNDVLPQLYNAIQVGMQNNNRRCLLISMVAYYGYARKINDPSYQQLEATVIGLSPDERAAWQSDEELMALMPYLDIPRAAIETRVSDPIFDAIRQGDIEEAKKLAATEQHRNARDINNMTPLHYAAGYNKLEVAKILLKNGVEVDALDNAKRTALSEAAYQGNTEFVNLLLEHGANPNLSDTNGATPLLFAALGNHTESAKSLINAGSNINSVDTDGNTPLMLAIYKRHTEMVKLLVNSGADIKIKNSRGLTAHDYASQTNQPHMIDILNQ